MSPGSEHVDNLLDGVVGAVVGEPSCWSRPLSLLGQRA
jgi:hypothetical protein